MPATARSAALLRAAAEARRSARLIDADVGQNMVGPPVFVTAADGAAPDRPSAELLARETLSEEDILLLTADMGADAA